MAMPRLDGSPWSSRYPPIWSSPAVIDSRPAIKRNRVDLPQPEGPTKTMNSFDRTSRSMPLMTSTEPKDLRTPRSCNPLIVDVPSRSFRDELRSRDALPPADASLHTTGQALDELTLEGEENDEGGQSREHR